MAQVQVVSCHLRTFHTSCTIKQQYALIFSLLPAYNVRHAVSSGLEYLAGEAFVPQTALPKAMAPVKLVLVVSKESVAPLKQGYSDLKRNYQCLSDWDLLLKLFSNLFSHNSLQPPQTYRIHPGVRLSIFATAKSPCPPAKSLQHDVACFLHRHLKQLIFPVKLDFRHPSIF